MRICDIKSDQIHVGMRIKSLAKPRDGTLVSCDYHDDEYWWIQWDGEDDIHSGFYGNDCKCEIVEMVATKK